jgi:hypothetical protein
MSKQIRNAKLESATARATLPIAGRPIWVRLAPGIHLGYRRNEGPGTWSVRNFAGRVKKIGLADDSEPAAPPVVLDFWQAQEAARAGASIWGATMVSLDDEEMSAVLALAAPLPPDRRSAFLEAVVQEASQHAEIGAGLISRIARARQRDFLVSNPIPTNGPGGATRQYPARARR